jgi:hypothetical protein
MCVSAIKPVLPLLPPPLLGIGAVFRTGLMCCVSTIKPLLPLLPSPTGNWASVYNRVNVCINYKACVAPASLASGIGAVFK